MRTKLNNIRFNEKDKCIEFEYGGQTFHYDIKEIEKVIITSWNNQHIIDELEKYLNGAISDNHYTLNGKLYSNGAYIVFKLVLSKLIKLKGSDFNE